MTKLVSVIMGIYNCQDTLAESIDCIVNQTYTNWELIMCDDASKDGTINIALEYANKYPDKIKVLKNETNKGLNFTLNKCLKEVKGEYVARMDGDDTCSPNRFEKEVSFLKNNPDYAIVSTNMNFFDEQGVWGKTTTEEFPTTNSFLKFTPFCHAACMVRKEAYDAVGGYSVAEKLLRVEDYHLWIKMYAKGYKGANLQEPLYQMRDDRNAQSRRKFKYRLNESYVKAYAIKEFGLSKFGYIYCLVPILSGIIPGWVYKILHRQRYSKYNR